jgi:alpha-tubulin suppressor-like RCC1 family protein
LVSFGSAAHGKLGIGPVKADSIYHEAIEIEGVEMPICISAGENHSAAINSAGFLYCWGQNSMGQLGIDSSDDHWEPVQLEDAGWKEVACGYNHTVAIDSLSKIKHWGELAAVVEPKHLTNPTTVDGIEQLRFKTIAAGNRFSVAINEKGRIFTWGYANNGRIGNNPSTKKEFEKIEMRVPGQILGLDSMQFIKVSCGNSHAIALGDKGDVIVWGFGTLGRLGIES